VQITDPSVSTVATYRTGEHAGAPAVTMRRVGLGTASYVSTRLDPPGMAPILRDALAVAGIESELPVTARGAVELAVRVGSDGTEYWFLINRTDATLDVPEVDGQVLHGHRVQTDEGPIRLAQRSVAVIARPRR
jgi:beta-galactosidase